MGEPVSAPEPAGGPTTPHPTRATARLGGATTPGGGVRPAGGAEPAGGAQPAAGSAAGVAGTATAVPGSGSDPGTVTGWEPVARQATYEAGSGPRPRTGSRPGEDPRRRPPPLGTRGFAGALGVSRVAVREAVGVLKALGVARTTTRFRPRRAGPSSAPGRPTPWPGSSSLHVLLASVRARGRGPGARIALERESARLAAAHALAPDWAAMRTHLDVMAGEQVTVAEFNEHDTAFHVAIARASGNPLVTEMTIALRQAMRGTLLDRLSALPTSGPPSSGSAASTTASTTPSRRRRRLGRRPRRGAHIHDFYADLTG